MGSKSTNPTNLLHFKRYQVASFYPLSLKLYNAVDFQLFIDLYHKNLLKSTTSSLFVYNYYLKFVTFIMMYFLPQNRNKMNL